MSCFVTVIGIWVAFMGIKTLPKCRFGEADCYFKVTICMGMATTGLEGGCQEQILNRAIEGSTDNPDGSGFGEPVEGAEALAIPCFAIAMALLPALLTALGVLFRDRYYGFLSASKILAAMQFAFLAIGVRVVQDLTFDCRWWNDNHHGNSDVCHGGLNLYVLGVVMIALAQLMSLMVSTQRVEDTYREYYSAQDYEKNSKDFIHSLDAE